MDYILFYPLSRQQIPFRSTKSCIVRSNKPLQEYGGWGIRYNRSGKACNACGNIGVQLELEQQKNLLISSQRSEQLA